MGWENVTNGKKGLLFLGCNNDFSLKGRKKGNSGL